MKTAFETSTYIRVEAIRQFIAPGKVVELAGNWLGCCTADRDIHAIAYGHLFVRLIHDDGGIQMLRPDRTLSDIVYPEPVKVSTDAAPAVVEGEVAAVVNVDGASVTITTSMPDSTEVVVTEEKP